MNILENLEDTADELIHLRAMVRMVRRMVERGDDASRLLAILDTPVRRPPKVIRDRLSWRGPVTDD